MRNRRLLVGLVLAATLALSHIGTASPASAAISITHINDDVTIDGTAGVSRFDLSAIQITSSQPYVTAYLQISNPTFAAVTNTAENNQSSAHDWSRQMTGASAKYTTADGMLVVSGTISGVNSLIADSFVRSLPTNPSVGYDDEYTYAGYEIKSTFIFPGAATVTGSKKIWTTAKTLRYSVPLNINSSMRFVPSTVNKLPTIAINTTAASSVAELTLELTNEAGTPTEAYGVIGQGSDLSGTSLVHSSTGTWTIQANATVSAANTILGNLYFNALSGASSQNLKLEIRIVTDTNTGDNYNFLTTMRLNPGTSIECIAGKYSVTGTNSTMICRDAPAGFSSADVGVTAPIPCPAGSFTENASSTECLPTPVGRYASGIANTSGTMAAPGSYVPLTGMTTSLLCPLGTYSAGNGNSECSSIPVGTFTSATGTTAPIQCPAGTYQSIVGFIGSSCTQVSANYYAGAGSGSQTACPSGYTSPAGSTSSAACVAPASAPVAENTSSAAVATPTSELPACRVSVKGKATVACLLASIGKSQPAGSKASLTVTSNKSACKVSGTKVQGKKVGACNVRVTLKPKKGAKTVYATTLNVG